MQHSYKAASTDLISLTSSDLYCHSHSPFYLRGDQDGNVFHHHDDEEDALNLSTSSIFNDLKASNVSIVSNSNLQFGGSGVLNNSLGSAEMMSTGVDSGHFISDKGILVNSHHPHQFENWADSGVVADHSQHTDTSTDTDDKTQYPGVHHERLMAVDSMDHSNAKIGDQKMLRRLAQNREAARKSRMRKKAYIQQLENGRLKLAQLEQELKRSRQQGVFLTSGYSGDQSHSVGGIGGSAFDADYSRWLDEHHRLINDLRSAINSQMGDTELRLLVEGVMSHYDEIFRLKSMGAKSDIFHMLSGIWKTPVERCFMWLGGFRCSEILKILGNQIEPLTEQQLMGICNLQQSSQQAEDALSQGMEALQQSLVETLSSNDNSANVANYMGQMAIAMSKLATLENFLHQADLLRQQTLQQLRRILTTRQAARALLAISDYKSRFRALSSLWLARPKE